MEQRFRIQEVRAAVVLVLGTVAVLLGAVLLQSLNVGSTGPFFHDGSGGPTGGTIRTASV